MCSPEVAAVWLLESGKLIIIQKILEMKYKQLLGWVPLARWSLPPTSCCSSSASASRGHGLPFSIARPNDFCWRRAPTGSSAAARGGASSAFLSASASSSSPCSSIRYGATSLADDDHTLGDEDRCSGGGCRWPAGVIRGR